MSTRYRSEATKGLKYVLGDVIALLQGEGLTEKRRSFVLTDLMDLFAQASRGSELATERKLLVGISDTTAYRSYSLLHQYLRATHNGNLKERLAMAGAILGQLAKGESVASNERQEVQLFLQQLLGSIKNQDALARQPEPEILELA